MNSMKKWFLKNWLKWRVTWSNCKNKGDITNIVVTETIDPKDTAFLTKLRALAKTVYSKFIWTMDNAEDLFDCMRTPARCYSEFKQGTLKDDCDGFHACIMQILKESNIDSVLLTYMMPDLNDCHTILVAKNNNAYYKIDYTAVTKYASLELLVNGIKEKHPDLIAYNLVKFDKKYYVVENF